MNVKKFKAKIITEWAVVLDKKYCPHRCNYRSDYDSLKGIYYYGCNVRKNGNVTRCEEKSCPIKKRK